MPRDHPGRALDQNRVLAIPWGARYYRIDNVVFLLLTSRLKYSCNMGLLYIKRKLLRHLFAI